MMSSPYERLEKIQRKTETNEKQSTQARRNTKQKQLFTKAPKKFFL